MNRLEVIKKQTLPQVIGWLLVILGFVGFFAAADLSIEKVAILKNPDYQPSCNVNPILSCGSVMSTKQAEAFGFPNPFIGVASFAIIVTVGMALLAGAKFKRWFWIGLQAGTVFGLLFVHWLMYQSIFNIGALCLYCIVVWTVTIPLFWYTLLYNIRQKNIRIPDSWQKTFEFASKNHANILIFWYLAIFLVILVEFWYYWSTLL